MHTPAMCLIALAAAIAASAGPFGLTPGEPLSAYEQDATKVGPDTWNIKPPGASSMFTTYKATFSPTHGLVAVTATSNPIRSGGKTRIADLCAILSKRYGELVTDPDAADYYEKTPDPLHVAMRNGPKCSYRWRVPKGEGPARLEIFLEPKLTADEQAAVLTLTYEFEGYAAWKQETAVATPGRS